MAYRTNNRCSRIATSTHRKVQSQGLSPERYGEFGAWKYPPLIAMEVMECRVLFAIGTYSVNAPDALVGDAPVIISGGGGATASVTVAENTANVTTVAATDSDSSSSSLTYSITGGPDGDAFTIDASMGVLSFVIAPNFEDPTDTGGDNTFEVTVQVSDGLNLDSQAMVVTVTDVVEPPTAPVITNNGGGPNASVSLIENTNLVAFVTATDADTPASSLVYSIAGGADADKFSINSLVGVLTFISAPNFESPTDVGLNNVYDVVVQVSDGVNTDSQAIAVTVTDADEAPIDVAPTLTTVSTLEGATVETPYTISYATLAAAANENDGNGDTLSFRVESVLSGVLTRNGIPVTPGVTLLNPGGQLVWTPANTSGTAAAFTVTAFDGAFSSGTPVTVSVNVTDQFAHVLTPGANGKFTFTDSQGHKITVALTGKSGTATLIRAVADNQSGDLLELDAAGTDNTSRITISAPAKSSTNVTDILVTGALNALSGSGVHILGNVAITGSATTVTLGDLSTDPTLTLGGEASSKSSTIKLGHAADLVLTSTGPIKSLNAIDWNGGSITAPAVETFTVGGAFMHSTLTCAGGIKSITVGLMNDSSIFVGTAAGVNGLASSVGDFVLKPATPSVGSVTIKGINGQPAFVDSIIDAWNIGKLDLKTVTTNNAGTPLGIAADKIASIRFMAPGVNNGKVITISKLDTPADLADPKKNPAVISFPTGDFRLVLV
jgi:hypothetical protein